MCILKWHEYLISLLGNGNKRVLWKANGNWYAGCWSYNWVELRRSNWITRGGGNACNCDDVNPVIALVVCRGCAPKRTTYGYLMAIVGTLVQPLHVEAKIGSMEVLYQRGSSYTTSPQIKTFINRNRNINLFPTREYKRNQRLPWRLVLSAFDGTKQKQSCLVADISCWPCPARPRNQTTCILGAKISNRSVTHIHLVVKK